MTEFTSERDDSIARVTYLTKVFDRQVAVDSLSFAIPRQSILGLIGPSGCGKTTTVRLLTGVYHPTSGQVVVLGHEPSDFTPEIRARIGYMLQQPVLYPDLTVGENLVFASAIYGLGAFGIRRSLMRRMLDFVELTEHRRKPVRNISGGMKRRLSLAATLVHDPELLFLDEPTAGVDPVLRRKFWDHFRTLRDEGRTLLVTTQYVNDAAYCDLVAVMQAGRLLRIDTPDGLRRAAFGGEILVLELAERLDKGHLDALEQDPWVLDAELVDGMTVRLVVDEASTAIPHLVRWTQENNLGLQSVQEHLPPFDDVFVKLVESEQDSASEEDEGA